MADQAPRISVLMTAYNAEEFLRGSVQSILAQSFSDFEFIIINDGSTDSTGEILHRFSQQDPRIKLLHQDRTGLTRSLNHGLRLCSGDLVARMDADDISHPARLAKQLAFMDAHPGTSVLGCRYRMISSGGKALGYSPKALAREHEAMWRLPLGSTLPHPGVILRREAILQAGGYDEQRQHAEDYDLWCRLVQAGHHITNLPDCLLDYRTHPMQVSSIHSDRQRAISLAIAQQQFSWAISEDAPMQAVADLRQLCNGIPKSGGMGICRTDAAVELSKKYISATGNLFSRKIQRRTRHYLMRKFLKAGLMAATRLEASATIHIKAAAKLRPQ